MFLLGSTSPSSDEDAPLLVLFVTLVLKEGGRGLHGVLLRRIRFSSRDCIIGAGNTGDVLYERFASSAPSYQVKSF